ncbi:MAG: peptide chain release factor N(5)-glutamine methyltransferase [Planctomycetota bacterium]
MSDTTQQPWTIKRLLDWTVDFFDKSESGSSRLDAEVLLAEALECERISLYTRFDEVPSEPQLAQFRSWVKRRAEGEPVAYLVGHREFYSISFEVGPAVLIPRPETEHVVMAALEYVKRIEDRPIRVIDVGTGSGCIGITLAKQLRAKPETASVAIAATDVSAEALEIAKQNAEKHGVDDCVRFFQGDLLTALPNGSKPVHLIVSNPPYIGTGEIATIDEHVKAHEPHVALFSGHEGTEIIQRLIVEAKSMLLPGGALIFETSPINIDRCVQLVQAHTEFKQVSIEKDFAGHKRVVVAEFETASAD